LDKTNAKSLPKKREFAACNPNHVVELLQVAANTEQ